MRRAVEDAHLLGKGVLVGVSGGADSVCLLRVLVEVARGGGLRVEAAHVDHGMRPGSGADARFCRALAEELGVRFHLRELGAGDFAGKRPTQERARALRRRFLEEVCRDRGLAAVALAHHADDQVETVLYRLIRGAGPRGIAGMRPWAPPYLRPLLQVSGAELRALAAARGWPFREDPTNRDPRYARNRLRLEVLPALRTVHPGCDAAVLRFARLAAEDEACLSAVAEERFRALARREDDGVAFAASALGELPPALRRRLYLAAWARVGGEPGALEMRHLEALDGLLEPGRPHRRAPLPGPPVVAASYGTLWFLPAGVWAPGPGEATLAAPGTASIDEVGCEVCWAAVAAAPPGGVLLPADRGGGGIAVRSWRPGDRIPRPGGGSRKVKDLLMDARLPLWRRRRALVVEDAAGPLGLLAPGGGWSGFDAGTTAVTARWKAPGEPA
ncbi:MAG: tRNA lysidine(34) synthetase TilS [Deferrisomatales bacterium]